MLSLLSKHAYIIARRRVRIGDRFAARDGGLYQVFRFDDTEDARYPISARGEDGYAATFTPTGAYFCTHTCELDLVRFIGGNDDTTGN